MMQATIKILVGTVYGGSRDVADHIAPTLSQAGYQVAISETPTRSDLEDHNLTAVLIVCSTTGAGDFPPTFDQFYNQLKDQGAYLPHLRYGLIALGDSSYDETFCDAGRKIDQLLTEYGAQRIGQLLEVDAAEHFDATEPADLWAKAWLTALKHTHA